MRSDSRPSVVRFAEFRVDLRSHELWSRDRRVRLQEKPFLVLEALLERPGDVVTRAELCARLWPDGTVVDFDNNLNSAVASLRSALRDSSRATRIVETLPRVGYRLVATDVARVAHRPVTGRSVLLRRLALLAAAVLIVGFATLRHFERQTAVPAEGARAAREADARIGLVPGARQALQRGRFLQARAAGDDLDEALRAFDEAVRLAPDFADAHAGKAEVLALLGFRRGELRDRLARARESAERALALDARNAAAHRVIGMARLYLDWDVAGAGQAIDRALRLDPRDPYTRLAAASWLVVLGRHDAAVEAARRAVEIDPSAWVRADLGWFLLAAGRHDEAIAECEAVLEVAPDFTPARHFLVEAFAARGQAAAAVEAALPLLAGSEPASMGAARSARERLQGYRLWQLERTAAAAHPSPLGLALRHATLGDRERAIEHLARAHAERDPFFVYLRGYRELDGLRDDPRFAAVSRHFAAPSPRSPLDAVAAEIARTAAGGPQAS